jgi:hypothetical protein
MGSGAHEAVPLIKKGVVKLQNIGMRVSCECSKSLLKVGP